MMRSSVIKKGTWLASFILAVCLCAHAEVKLPAIFSDGMVMQQQTKANLWGTATPNKKITVTTGWNGKQYVATADKNGAWKLSVFGIWHLSRYRHTVLFLRPFLSAHSPTYW